MKVNNFSDFLDNVNFLSEFHDIYILAMSMAVANESHVEIGVYSRDSMPYKFSDAIFKQVRQKIKEVYGEEELNKMTSDFKENNMEYLKGISKEFINRYF